MLSLREVNEVREIDGIAVVLLNVENNVATFEDVDGNEHELMVKSPSIDAVNGARLLARCEDRDNLADRN